VRKTHVLVLSVVAIVIVLAIGAVSAYGTLADDVTAPTTTTDAVASYWDSAVITATATDAEGIRYIYHELDDGVVRLATIDGSPTSTQLTIPTAKDTPLAVGSHELQYWAQDVNGNVEAKQTVKFKIIADTVPPTTSATAASVKKGRTATLKYMVTDADPNKGTAAVVIKIKNNRHQLVMRIAADSVAVNAQLKAKFVCKLAKGTYKYHVYATDVAGNKQSKIGSAKLLVK
jgi:hypothetical protein